MIIEFMERVLVWAEKTSSRLSKAFRALKGEHVAKAEVEHLGRAVVALDKASGIAGPVVSLIVAEVYRFVDRPGMYGLRTWTMRVGGKPAFSWVLDKEDGTYATVIIRSMRKMAERHGNANFDPKSKVDMVVPESRFISALFVECP